MNPHFLRSLALCAVAVLPRLAWSCEGAVFIEVEHDDVYAVDHEAIVAQQPSLADCESRALYLSRAGKQVPIRVVDGGSGRFGPGARIEWVGEQLHGPQSWYNHYSINNTYLLSVADGEHSRIKDVAPHEGAPAALERVLHHESDSLMIRLDQNQQKPGEEPDVWQWAKLTHADPSPFEFEFDLPDLGGYGGVSITMNFRGLSRALRSHGHEPVSDHVVEVSINGQPVRTIQWDGRDEERFTFPLGAGIARGSGNKLQLRIPKRMPSWDERNPIVDVVMFNWIEFRFPIRGTLDERMLPFVSSSDRTHPIELQGNTDVALYGSDGIRRSGVASGRGGTRFAGAARDVTLFPAAAGRISAPVTVRAATRHLWMNPTHGYDYLIVSHASLIESIRPLAEFHERRGLKVAVIDVQDVYDAFNHGITHPQAIRNLVERAWHDWPAPKPRFLLLVGDASFDIRHDSYNDLAYAKFANNPTELAFPGHFAGIPGTQYEASSKRMAGRNLIPTWQFPSPEGQSASDNPFGAVDGDRIHPVVAVGRFPVVEPDEVKAIVDKTIGYMTKPQAGSWKRDVMFITDESDYFKSSSDEIAKEIGREGFVADKIYASKDEADNLAHQSAIKDGLNDGQLLVHFIGHGGRYIWRTGPPDIRKNHDLFTLDDVSGLSNASRLPMILSMTCYSAPFDNPTEDSIGERFLREADKGAVAVFAASWRNAPSTAFSKALVKELLAPGATIGEGIVRAKAAIDDRVLIEMYNLLGDPAVVLKRPVDTVRIALREDRWNPTLGIALPGPHFDGEVDVDWFDADGTRIAGGRYRIAQTRFELPLPRLGDGREAASVRLYAGDPRTGRDATASFDIKAERERIAARTVEPAAESASPRVPPKPTAPDTISSVGFDAEHPQLIAGN